VIAALDEHAIKRERGLRQPLHVRRHSLLSDLDAERVAVHARVDERQLRLHGVGDAVQ
jgi:hypothetical protein